MDIKMLAAHLSAYRLLSPIFWEIGYQLFNLEIALMSTPSDHMGWNRVYMLEEPARKHPILRNTNG